MESNLLDNARHLVNKHVDEIADLLMQLHQVEESLGETIEQLHQNGLLLDNLDELF